MRWKRWNEHTQTEVVGALRAVMVMANRSKDGTAEGTSSSPSAASWLLALHPVLACTIANASIHLARAYVGALVDVDEVETTRPADGNDARNCGDARVPASRRRRQQQTRGNSLGRIAKQVAKKRQRVCARATNIRNGDDTPYATTTAAKPIAETLVSTSWTPIDHFVHAVCCEQNSRIGKYVRAALTPHENNTHLLQTAQQIWPAHGDQHLHIAPYPL